MGKGGGALSAWLKEFTALVFTQTIQAFIYAIIISIILFGMKTKGDVNPDDNNSALGLMATFALLSVFKVEEMTKKIFGIRDTKASPGNAMKSIAKTAIAAKIGKRVLDNTGKVLGGVRSITKSRQDNRKARTRLEEDMQDMGFKYDEKTKETTFIGKPRAVGAGGSATGATVGGVMGGTVGSAIGGTVSSAGDGAMGAPGVLAGGGGSPVLSDVGGGSTGSAEAVSSGYAAAAASYSSGDSISAADKRRIRNAVRAYNDRMDEIKKSRDEGVKNIISGVAESITAPFGAAMGGLLGGADGNIDEMFQGIMAGAGIGDTVANSAVNAVDKATKFIQRNANHKPGISHKELKKAITSFEKAANSMNVNYGSSSVDDI